MSTTEEQPEAIGDGSLSLDGWAAQVTRAGLDEFHRRAAERTADADKSAHASTFVGADEDDELGGTAGSA